jgi:two-component system, cell cycle sensor histidine kinase and response regulator CckA
MGTENARTLQETADWFCRPEEDRPNRTGTILLVEDEDFVRRVACEVLLTAGYSVLSAKNGAEALCFFDQRPETVTLLLTDLVLPGENGRVLARKLRQRNARLKVLFVTGYAEQMASRAAEHEEFLAKPFSTSVLLRRVAQLLDHNELSLGKTEDKDDKENLLRPAYGKVWPAESAPGFETMALRD